MYFKRRICPNCGDTHDELLDYCPKCKKKNEDDIPVKRHFAVTFLNPSYEIFLIVLGIAGFALFTFIFGIIFRNIYIANNMQGLMLINVFSYVVFFLCILFVFFRFLRTFLDKIKEYKSYLYGLIGAIVLVIGSIIINLITNLIYPHSGDNANQVAIVNICKMYPAIAIIFFGIIGPICEEFVYRVGLFSFLKRIHPAVAYTGTAVIFALIHIDFGASDMVLELISLPSYIWGGLCLSFIYEIKGVAASCTSHILNNVYSFIMILVS